MTNPHASVTIRRARDADRAAVGAVEAQSTPGLRYVDQVFDLFMDSTQGEFLVAEVEEKVVACGKFTLLPDGSAWLETLRVMPDYQGMGIGKRFYEEFFAIARRTQVPTMRMYTGTKNVVSKGLAERFGFRLAERFGEVRLPLAEIVPQSEERTFARITDPRRATELILPHSYLWHDFLVMNRTFYKITAALCTMLATAGQVYGTPDNESVIVLGARFMPEEVVHIGLFGGDGAACLRFAMQQTHKQALGRLNCIYPLDALQVQEQLVAAGFQVLDATLIVMETDL